MNPLITPSSSLLLPLGQLSPHCSRLLNSINDDKVSPKEKLHHEQTLWSEVKKIRSLNEPSIYLYLIGYYDSILHQATRFFDHNNLFHYNILIRLGDLSRYMERLDVAEYYYCNARNIFPHFGHAYNQLGLLTKPTNCYKCCYYYARAAKSSEKPLKTIGDSNLRIAVSKYDCEILSRIIDNNGSETDSMSPDSTNMKLPNSAFDWLYVIVVAIHADNIAPIAKIFLSYLNDNFSTHKPTIARDGVKMSDIYCDRDSYIMLASLDILLDWMRLGTGGKRVCSSVALELRQIRISLLNVITSCKLCENSEQDNESNRTLSLSGILSHGNSFTEIQRSSQSILSNNSLNTTNLSQSSCESPVVEKRLPALMHDYVLRGFGPLDVVHQNLHFKAEIPDRSLLDSGSANDSSSDQRFIDSEQLLSISLRIKSKIDSFGSSIRKKTRNIALESILCNFGKDN